MLGKMKSNAKVYLTVNASNDEIVPLVNCEVISEHSCTLSNYVIKRESSNITLQGNEYEIVSRKITGGIR